MTHFLSLSGILLLLIEHAHAQVTSIITGFGNVGGATAATALIDRILTAGEVLVPAIAGLMLARAAAKMVGSFSDEKMEEGRTSVGTTILGIMLISLTSALVRVFWNGGSQDLTGAAGGLKEEIIGLVQWFQVLVGVLAVAMIILSVFKVVASFGKEDAGEELKKSIIGAIIGVMLVAFDGIVIAALGANDGSASPRQLVTMMISIVSNLLMYLATVAVIMIIYAGVMMIVSVGSDEQYQKSKSLIGRVIIGLLIVMFSYFIVNFFASAVS